MTPQQAQQHVENVRWLAELYQKPKPHSDADRRNAYRLRTDINSTGLGCLRWVECPFRRQRVIAALALQDAVLHPLEAGNGHDPCPAISRRFQDIRYTIQCRANGFYLENVGRHWIGCSFETQAGATQYAMQIIDGLMHPDYYLNTESTDAQATEVAA